MSYHKRLHVSFLLSNKIPSKESIMCVCASHNYTKHVEFEVILLDNSEDV